MHNIVHSDSKMHLGYALMPTLLRDITIKNLKPENNKRSVQVADTLVRGLSIIVENSANGKSVNKRWQFRTKRQGKTTLLGLGTYPEVSLSDARDKAQNLKSVAASGKSLTVYTKEIKAQERADNSFKTVALEWFERKKDSWVKTTVGRTLNILNNHIFPSLGNREISEITTPDVISMLDKLQVAGKLNMLEKTRQACGQIFAYAAVVGKTTNNPCYALRSARVFDSAPKKHYSHVSKPNEIAQLLKDIERYHGFYQTKMALLIAPYVFLRPGELAASKWEYIDWNERQWILPEEVMKARRKHIVPLSSQVFNLLQELHKFSGEGKYLFPSPRDNKKPIRIESLGKVLKSLSYKVTCNGQLILERI